MLSIIVSPPPPQTDQSREALLFSFLFLIYTCLGVEGLLQDFYFLFFYFLFFSVMINTCLGVRGLSFFERKLHVKVIKDYFFFFFFFFLNPQKMGIREVIANFWIISDPQGLQRLT